MIPKGLSVEVNIEVPQNEVDWYGTMVCEGVKNFLNAYWKHPLYAEGKYQALGVVQSEIAEFLKAIERGTDEEAVAEAKDAIVTLQRFILGHHLPEEQRGYGWEKRISE